MVLIGNCSTLLNIFNNKIHLTLELHVFTGIRVPKVPFRFFDKLKCEIRNRVLIFVSILS